MAKMYYDKDADLSALKGKTIAILGYGSQGHAHAQNLRDSGCTVIVGQRTGGPNYDLAVSHGFEPLSAEEATKRADMVNMLLPDEVQGDIYRQSVRDNLKPGNILMCSHGFNVHFGQVEAPPGVDIVLVAPKGPGHLVRSEFEKGGGVPCLIAFSEGAERRQPPHRTGLCQGHWRRPGWHYRNHVRRRDRDRPVRRTSRAVRRRQRAGQGGLRNAGRGRLSARDGLLRVHARAQADRRPVLPGRLELHALQRLEHGRIRRLHPRPAHRDRRNPGGNETHPCRDPVRPVRP